MDGDRRYRQSRQKHVEKEYFGYNLSVTKSVIGCSLIEMRSVSVPESFTIGEPSEQGDRRIGDVIQRQQQGRGKMLM